MGEATQEAGPPRLGMVTAPPVLLSVQARAGGTRALGSWWKSRFSNRDLLSRQFWGSLRGTVKSGPAEADAVRPQRWRRQPLCGEGSDLLDWLPEPIRPALSALFPPPSLAAWLLPVHRDSGQRAPPSGSVSSSDPRHGLPEEQGPVLASGPS